MTELFFEKSISNEAGNIQISLVNGVRRCIICDVEVYNISMDDTQFYENSSPFDNEFINKRLAKIPIISDYTDVDYEGLRIECKVKNSTFETMHLYARDLIFKNDRGEVITDKSFCRFSGILLIKLKPNQSLSFETRLKKDCSQTGGALYNPTCTCVHTFEIDRAAVDAKVDEMGIRGQPEERTFRLDESEQIYQKTATGLPALYHMKIESVGHLLPERIYQEGVEKLKGKLMVIKSEINQRNGEKITIAKNPKSDEVFDVNFLDENDTTGNILSEYLSIDPEVKYVGYRLPHPLKYEMHMKISLLENNNIEGITRKYIETIQKILEIIEESF